MEGGNGVSRPEDERVQWSRLQACLEGRNAVSRPEDEREGGDHSLRVTETDTNQQLLTYSTYSYRTIAKKHPCQSGVCSERAHSMDPGGVSLGRPPAGKHTRHTLKARAGGELGCSGCYTLDTGNTAPWTLISSWLEADERILLVGRATPHPSLEGINSERKQGPSASFPLCNPSSCSSPHRGRSDNYAKRPLAIAQYPQS